MTMLSELRKGTEELSAIQASLDSRVKKIKAKQAAERAKYLPPPKTKRPRLSRDEMVAAYHDLRRKLIDRIADRFVHDSAGKDTYRRVSTAYGVVGKYKVSPEFIDFDQDLRHINTVVGDKERLKALKKLAAKLGVRT